jgi:hypothetical protein
MTIKNNNNKSKNDVAAPMSIKEAFDKASVKAGYTSIKQYKSTLINVIKN